MEVSEKIQKEISKIVNQEKSLDDFYKIAIKTQNRAYDVEYANYMLNFALEVINGVVAQTNIEDDPDVEELLLAHKTAVEEIQAGKRTKRETNKKYYIDKKEAEAVELALSFIKSIGLVAEKFGKEIDSVLKKISR